MALLEVDAATVRFGGNVALDGVSLAAEPGVVTGLIGPNGAGKTTLFNVITGLLPPNHGPHPPRRPRRHAPLPHPAGPARARPARSSGSSCSASSASARTSASPPTSARAGRATRTIPPRWSRRSSTASGSSTWPTPASTRSPPGQCRLVELGRCLATKPKVLLLDEPASGQDESETVEFAQPAPRHSPPTAWRWCSSSTTSRWSWTCARTVHVLDFGRIIATGTPAEIQTDEAVLAAYLGSSS